MCRSFVRFSFDDIDALLRFWLLYVDVVNSLEFGIVCWLIAVIGCDDDDNLEIGDKLIFVLKLEFGKVNEDSEFDSIISKLKFIKKRFFCKKFIKFFNVLIFKFLAKIKI